ncbi:uncharacterized protein LOC132796371 isoform X1 [Drosophila nasuta]|uniref:uncharacterized protein LOC132796371 isoform X1 n=1 Tax=Drosophila nasuta TaxID=42062 RepID=UPI00295ECF89|nr:uncharacterized protein LOC132796371 isoform X1 [Drosophila nasuta]
MKIIFFGLLIAILVVYGHGDRLDAIVKASMEDAIDAHNKRNDRIKEDNDWRAKEIEKYQKEIDEDETKLSDIKDKLTNPNFSTEERNFAQRSYDVIADYIQKRREKFERMIKLYTERIRRSVEETEHLNKLYAKLVNSTGI